MIEPGDCAPDFVLPGTDGRLVRFLGHAGGAPTVVAFLGTAERGPFLAELARAREALVQQSSTPIDVFAIAPVDPHGDEASIPVFVDADAKVAAAYGLEVGDAPCLVALDPNLRVVAVHRIRGAELPLAKLFAGVRRPEPFAVDFQAPVLLIPDVLEPARCKALVAAWSEGHRETTGVERSRSGRRVAEVTSEHKRRSDVTVRDPELMAELSRRIGRRVMPEVRKAFAFRATRFEGFKIACYDAAEGGWFHPHRDNLSPATAHRRFALSLNLNDDYEGGALRFPEYAPHLYRPPAGGAVVFSGSLLHEALAVTRGRRFVVLSFLYGEDDARARNTPSADRA